MNKPLDPMALFRLSVLGPLASRGDIARGELKKIISELATRIYTIPGSDRIRLSEETIKRWYYAWKKNSIGALETKPREDKGLTKLPDDIKTAITELKKDNPARSLNTIINMLERKGIVQKDSLSRATVHRFLQNQKMSKRVLGDSASIERRAFVAENAGDIWHGDVLHGPRIQTKKGMKKTYLVSLLDDKTRMIMHSLFCFGETALDIEGVLKQAVLKRGVPRKLIIDNGPAYRAHTLQSICARLEIRFIYSRPYEPESKGKIERFHRTFREQFLNEIEIDKLFGADELNDRLQAWIDLVYHKRPHEGLDGKTPQELWMDDLIHLRPLGLKALNIDDVFYYREKRVVRKDGTVNWDGFRFEVPYEYAKEKIIVVIDPHTKTPIRIESLNGDPLGNVVKLDVQSNLNRKRQRPNPIPAPVKKRGINSVEMAYDEYSDSFNIPMPEKFEEEE